MQVILQDNIDNLGKVGDIVKVKPGYARNYLIPRGLAAEASTRNVSQLEHQKRAAEAKKGKIKPNDVIVIRYEGPRGGPGMREMLHVTGAL